MKAVAQPHVQVGNINCDNSKVSAKAPQRTPASPQEIPDASLSMQKDYYVAYASALPVDENVESHEVPS